MSEAVRPAVQNALRAAGAITTAHDATVAFGPAATPEQEQAIREQEYADAVAAVARLEDKAEAVRVALDQARAEVERTHRRAREGGNG